MSVGMGLMFVPLTLTAVHHLRAEDSGIGSGVLNTMQQVGGALGLATAVDARAPQTITDRELGARRGAAAGGRRRPEQVGGPDGDRAVQVFTEGATDAFLLGAV